ncbi:MAG: serine/threonine-protein kinase [Myxococcota bacterium]
MADPREPESPNDPLVGKTLGGRYLVQSLVDRGGMGKVYLAEQQPLGRRVALKTLDLLDPRGEFQQRFFNEASIASRLTHPNTVRIFDYGRSDEGVYYITMEYLEGLTLHKMVKAEAPLDPQRLIAIMRQVCGALHEAHELGIVHRDLKPGNIFLTRHGDEEVAKVLDFGLVKNLESDIHLSQTGQTLGSPLYMSPEQVEGDNIDRRADIYSLGLVMYVALSGKVPFKKGSVATIMMQQVTGTIPSFATIAPNVEIPASIEWIVRRCIEKQREKRFATMRELSNALKLASRELKSEVGAVPWNLDDTGHLALPDELLGPSMESSIGTEEVPRTELLEINEIPSSPTLNRSSVSMAAGAVFAGGGLLMFVVAGVLLLMVLAIAIGIAVNSSSSKPETVPVLVPNPHPVVTEPKGPGVISVRIDSTPTGAEVSRAGAYVGTTPMAVSVGEGGLTVTLKAAGHLDREVFLDGTTTELLVPLQKRPLRVGPTDNVPKPLKPTPTPGDPAPSIGRERGAPK